MVEKYPDNETFAQLRDQKVEGHFKVKKKKEKTRTSSLFGIYFLIDIIFAPGRFIHYSRIKVIKTRSSNWRQ